MIDPDSRRLFAKWYADLFPDDLAQEEDYRDPPARPADDEDPDDLCRCSDPRCPCRGRKRGSHND